MWDVERARAQWQRLALAPMPDAQVWLIRLPADSEGVSAATRACLSTEEVQRAERFAQAHHAMRYMAAHAAARTLLGDILGRAPQTLVWRAQADGKPCLDGHSLQFNLSHSGVWALLTTHPTLHVGVDLEVHAPWQTMDDLAAEVLDPAEAVLWGLLPPATRAPALFAAWTRKEACLKAWGTGLRTPPQQVHVGMAVAPAKGRWVPDTRPPRPACVHWQDLTLPLAAPHSACMAWCQP